MNQKKAGALLTLRLRWILGPEGKGEAADTGRVGSSVQRALPSSADTAITPSRAIHHPLLTTGPGARPWDLQAGDRAGKKWWIWGPALRALLRLQRQHLSLRNSTRLRWWEDQGLGLNLTWGERLGEGALRSPDLAVSKRPGLPAGGLH